MPRKIKNCNSESISIKFGIIMGKKILFFDRQQHRVQRGLHHAAREEDQST